MAGTKSTNIEVGCSQATGDDPFAVGVEAAGRATADISLHSPSVVILFASVRYDLKELLRGIRSVISNAPVIGVTTAGEICNGTQTGSVTVVVLASPHLKVRIGVGEGVSQDWQNAVTQAVNSPEISPFFSSGNSSVWQELTRQGKAVFGLLFSPGNTRHTDSRSDVILDKLKRLSQGRVPIFGGSAADDWRMECNYVLYGNNVYHDSLLLAVFETGLKFGTALAHGFRPGCQQCTVTRARGQDVLELDGQPAAEVYSQLLRRSREELEGKHLTLTTGQPVGSLDRFGQYRIDVASYFTHEGGVRLTQPLPVGSILTIMQAEADNLVMAGREAMQKALFRGNIINPAMILVFSCALRQSILGERIEEEISRMKEMVPRTPIAGFYSFGEQGLADNGVNDHNHEVMTVLVIGQELSYSLQVALENERLRDELELRLAEFKQIEQELQKAHVDLEIKVQDRTAELARANKILLAEVSERKRAEKESRDMFNFLQTLIDTIPSCIFYKDTSGIYLGCNKAYVAFLGRNKDEIIGKSVYEVFPKDLADKYREMDLALFRQPGKQVYEWEILHADGSRRDVIFNRATFSSCDGTLAGLVGDMVDITELKKAGRALRESEERYRLVFENAPLGIMHFDNASIITDCNNKMADIIGAPKEKIIGLNMLLQLRDEQALEAVLAALEGKTGYYEGDYLSITGGKLTALRAFFQRIASRHGEFSGAVGILEDITERKRFEEELSKIQKLESAGVLAGGIAHDFNNLLCIILGYISLAQMELNQSSKPFNQLKEAAKACLHSKDLTKQLITFSSCGMPNKKAESVQDILKVALNLALAGSNIKCKFRADEDLWHVNCDSDQLQQAFLNVIINAREAMPKGGLIVIEGSNVELEEGRNPSLNGGKYVRISIKDSGTGIPKDRLSKLFDPYFSTKERGAQKGMGLGLTIAFSIIKRHEGHISVESQTGAGTTFHIYISAFEGSLLDIPERERAPLEGQGKVLLMDDEAMLRDMAGQMLARLGYEVELARDGVEAVELFRKAKDRGVPFDVVVLDLTVRGGMGGKEAINELLGIDNSVKAIVSSGYSNDPMVSNFEEFGFSGVLVKPYQIGALAQMLHSVIGSG